MFEQLRFDSTCICPDGSIVQTMRLTVDLGSQVRILIRPHNSCRLIMQYFIPCLQGFSPSLDWRRTVASYWRNYVYKVLVKRLEEKCESSSKCSCVSMLTDRLDMTLGVDWAVKLNLEYFSLNTQLLCFHVSLVSTKKLCLTTSVD